MTREVSAFLSNGIDSLARIFGYMSGFILLVMMAITCYEVVARYVFNSPTIWSVDLGIFLLIWFAYSSTAYVQRERRHVRVDLLTSRLSGRTREIWEVLNLALFLLFAVVLVHVSLDFTIHTFKAGEYGWMLWRVLLWPVRAAIPVGTAVLALLLMKDLVGQVRVVRACPEEKQAGILAKPALLVLVFLALVAAGAFLITVNKAAGLVFLTLVMLFGGLPIFPALGTVGMMGIFLLYGGADGVMTTVPRMAYCSLDSFALVVIPLFIALGQILSDAGVGKEIYNLCTKWVGGLAGGEAIATVLSCAVFAAISTSSVATAATIGLVALPALAARKYNKNFSYGLLAAGGTLGIMIPPSGSMIIYSAVTEESLGKLFLAGIFPGLLLVGAFIVYSVWFCKRTSEYERQKSVTWGERFAALKTGIWGLLAPAIIIGGIYSGIFTPLESGAIALAYAVIMVLARRKLKVRELPRILRESSLNSTMVLSIIVGALVLGNLVTLMRIPNIVMEYVAGLGVGRWWVMAAIMLLYIVLGMFLEVISCMLITLPIIYPLIISLGFDGLWFAVMVTLNMEVALITPPVGLNLYCITGIARTSIDKVLRGVWPFFIIMLVGLFLFAIFQPLSTWLPGAMISR